MRRTAMTAIVVSVLSVMAAGQTASTPQDRPKGQQSGPGLEQQQLAEFFQKFREASMPLAREGNLLGQLVLLKELLAAYPKNASIQDAGGQFLGTLYSFVGRPREAHRLFDARPPDPAEPRVEIEPPPASFQPTPAVQAIVRAAASRRTVMINEAHHVAEHRLLTLALLAPLRELGYRYFAAETFSYEDAALNTRPYPVHSSGFYTNEPLFAHVVREARRLGYTLVPYEASNPGSPDAREQGQAQNLKERIFDKDPDAKVLVHAGYAHIDESGSLVGAPPMAVRFKALTGFDPLTVDQTTLTPRGNSDREPAAYRALESRLQPDTPTAFASQDGLWSARPGVHDMTVMVPRTPQRDGRPAWLFALGRSSVQVAGDVCAAAYPCLVAARLEGEPREAVPVDALLVERKADRIVLLLPPGRYRIEGFDAAGTIKGTISRTVQD